MLTLIADHSGVKSSVTWKYWQRNENSLMMKKRCCES